jgi:hypothetical protein
MSSKYPSNNAPSSVMHRTRRRYRTMTSRQRTHGTEHPRLPSDLGRTTVTVPPVLRCNQAAVACEATPCLLARVVHSSNSLLSAHIVCVLDARPSFFTRVKERSGHVLRRRWAAIDRHKTV